MVVKARIFFIIGFSKVSFDLGFSKVSFDLDTELALHGNMSVQLASAKHD